MISVKDLNKWAKDHAIGRSTTFPEGWVSSDNLMKLVQEIKEVDPLPFRYSLEEK